mmetsp:Transcript_57575/g.140609  ORF Transcript_57575/g.140609 Transcript_57575/m.140609 type:complete len:104 (-) Transcript_57575:38-349(-)
MLFWMVFFGEMASLDDMEADKIKAPFPSPPSRPKARSDVSESNEDENGSRNEDQLSSEEQEAIDVILDGFFWRNGFTRRHGSRQNQSTLSFAPVSSKSSIRRE